MSRWSYGNWAMAAVVMEDNGSVYPLSKLSSHRALKAKGYYSESFLLGPRFYRMDDLTGSMGSKGEGSFTIQAHLQITDASGGTKTLQAECEGYTCCGTDCYMLLIVTPGKDAATTTVEFQEVDEVELREAVGGAHFDAWRQSKQSSNPVILDEAPF